MTPLKTYEVTGDLIPDATGTYEDGGERDGQRYYHRNSDWYIWWDEGNVEWNISTALGVEGASWWDRDNRDIEGNYEEKGTAEGTATVTEI